MYSKGAGAAGFRVELDHVTRLEVLCLPGDIPHAIELDITDLDIGDAIHVEDIDLGENVEIPTDVNFTVVTYPGVKHSFTNPDADMFAEKFGLPLAYNAEADQKSWAEMQTFLKTSFAE